jgi:hypothetical protein
MTTTASTYYNNIDVTFPVAGQDNSSQGFRDNFNNTVLALADVDTRLVSVETKNVNNLYFTTSEPASSKGSYGDLTGMVYANGTSVYVCYSDYTDGSLDIWAQIATVATTW